MRIDYLSRKEQIVLTTIGLIHEVGVSSISMKEIARREEVTEASLYKHFKSKDELLGEVLEYFEKYDEVIHRTLQNSEEQIGENIFRYFTIYAEYYSSYREITSLIHVYDVLAYHPGYVRRAREFTEKKADFLADMIWKGQDKEEFVIQCTPECLSGILLGSFERVITMWRQEEYAFGMKEKTEEVIGNILKAFGVIKETDN